MALPKNLARLHAVEEELRAKAISLVAGCAKMQLHLATTEAAMEMADALRQFHTDDEDLKVVQLLGMRTFNAFGSSIKLALAGYAQNSALVMRDILETVFLLELFSRDRSLITRWRTIDKKTRKKDFSPIKVRMALDERDGNTSLKRAKHYEMFSELAGHPSMQSAFMMRPNKDGDAVMGPFVEHGTLDAVISEMGRLGVLVGETLDTFVPPGLTQADPSRAAFAFTKRKWIEEFFPRSRA